MPPKGQTTLTESPSLPDIRMVAPERLGRWLDRGVADFLASPGLGLAYGSVFAAIGWLVAAGLSRAGMGSLALPLAGGFLMVAPLAAAGLYEASRRRERGETTTALQALAAVRRNPQAADLGFVLLLLFFAWIQVAMVLFALFFGGRPPALDEFLIQVATAPQGVPFLAAGTILGGLLAAVAFALSVVSMPMLLDRDISAMTAMRTSLHAAWVNRKVMAGWAVTLATLGGIGLVFLFAGLAVTLPIAAHASWHAYRDLVADR